jgi:hypothetical protein
MKLVKNELQKQGAAKFLYDIAKIIFGVIVAAQIVKPEEFKVWIFASGVAAMVIFFSLAYLLDGKEIRS